MGENNWTVVHFTKEDTVEVVPDFWANALFCYWPPVTYNYTKIKKSIISKVEPESNWQRCSSKVLGEYGTIFILNLVLCTIINMMIILF